MVKGEYSQLAEHSKRGMKKKALPPKLEEIGEGAFAGCTLLALDAPNAMLSDVTRICFGAFAGCTSLVLDGPNALPPSVTSIETARATHKMFYRANAKALFNCGPNTPLRRRSGCEKVGWRMVL